jgi:hypothetical protein
MSWDGWSLDRRPNESPGPRYHGSANHRAFRRAQGSLMRLSDKQRRAGMKGPKGKHPAGSSGPQSRSTSWWF